MISLDPDTFPGDGPKRINKEYDDFSKADTPPVPIEHVPPEVLGCIFRILCQMARKEETDRNVMEPSSQWNFEPDMTKAPWVLGKVCSTWRHLSRTMPNLWSPTRVWLSDAGSRESEHSARTLRLAVATLPDCAQLIVHYYVLDAAVKRYPDKGSIAEALASNLHRIDEVSIHSPITYWNSFLSTLPSLSLSRITSLSSLLFPTGNIAQDLEAYPPLLTSIQHLFGENARLQTLQMDGSVYEFFKTGIPWHRLTTLKLYQSYPVSNDTISAYRNLHFFGSSSRLTDLTLWLDSNMFQLVLSLDIPWTQLLRLNITMHTQDCLLLALEKLAQCVSLLEISLCLPSNAGVKQSVLDLPSIQSFSLQGHLPRFLLRSHGIWESISDLYLGLLSNTESVQELHSVISRCQQLQRLRIGGVMHPTDSIWLPSSRVVLPRLKTLELRRAYSAWIFDSFATPSLVSLRIDANGQPSYTLKCKLDLFFLNYSSVGSKDGELRSLLEALSTASYVELSSVKFHEDILDDITRGTLLPRIQILRT
ncbi:hypothetical protein C0995_012408 [Termitomyces sp. Mi166|nr:hypothetical protein C0995_012408 [Termitomyces sp. Mi166\